MQLLMMVMGCAVSFKIHCADQVYSTGFSNRLEKQRAAYQTFDASLKKCEKTIYDLDIGSVWKSSAFAPNRGLEKRLEEVMVRKGS